jgi:heme/copper-type cytochrome/quinol oxidase subunit 1
MKTFLIALIISVVSIGVNAQQRFVSQKDTNTNATTTYITFPAIQSNVKSFSAVVTKISGTVAGTVILQGTDDGTNWFNIDTLTLANQATNQRVYIPLKTYYYSYRQQFITTGTQVSSLVASWCRRPDEHE